jgi:hypothetical protein
MEFVSLKRGNPNNLEGKVTVYSEWNINLSEMPFLTDLIKRSNLGFDIDRVHLSNFYSTNFDDIIKRLNSEEVIHNEHSFKMGDDENFFIMHGVVNMPKILIDDVISDEGDVVYAGRWDSPFMSKFAIDYASKLYHFRFVEQLLRNKKYENVSKTNNIAIPEGEIGRVIESRYIGRMLDASRGGDGAELERLKIELIGATRKTPYCRDVMKICSLISVGGNPNYDHLHAYALKIKSIEKQDFETAARMRDRIKDFEGKND